MSKKKLQKPGLIKKLKSNINFKVLGAVMIGLSVPLTLLLVMELWLLNRSIPNIYIGNVPIGNMTQSEISQRLALLFEERKSGELSIVDEGQVLATLEAMENFYSYDVQKTTENILKYGKNGNYLDQLKARLFALRDTYRVVPVYGFDREGFDLYFAEKLATFEEKVQDARYEFTNGKLEIIAEKSGYAAQREDVISEIDHYLAFTSSESNFEINFGYAYPKITSMHLDKLRGEMTNIVGGSVTLTSAELNGQTFKLSPEEIFEVTRVELSGEGTTVRFDEYKVAEKTRQIAELVKKDPLDAVFQYDGSRVIDFQPAIDGTELDTGRLTEELKIIAISNVADKRVELPLKRTAPAITTASVNDYGIREIVGSGRSVFTGSAPGRVHNVALASKKLNGLLIAPDEVFSMYAAVGDIEKESGFQDAFVIKNGRTIPGVGGGVCQVSTTLFRAALNAGLPIVERRPHAYRVSYYEKDSLPGMDAAIYFPDADLRFKNDTGNYLLLQTKVDTKKMTAEFNLFGVKDGRIVEISKPVIGGQTPPPPDLYIDDPNLQRGQTVKDEYAAWGATVSFSRKVTLRDQVISEDVFKSSYRPWQAVFRVGTKDS